MDCLLVRVNNRLSRTSGQVLFRTLPDVLILSNVPVYIGPYRVACLRIYCINLMFCLKYQWPWCPAYWPRCPLIIFKSQGQLALPSNCPNSRPGTRYSVFEQLILNPLFSIMALHLSSSSSTSSAVSLASTKSSANSIAQGGLVLASSANTSMIIMKRSLNCLISKFIFEVGTDMLCHKELVMRRDTILSPP